MDKENDKNVSKQKQTLHKIVMSLLLREEEQTELKHCTTACKLEGEIGIKMYLGPCRRQKSKSKQEKRKKKQERQDKVKAHKMEETNSNILVQTTNTNELNSH